ncbi:MAG: ATP-binding protein [Rhodoblastus sp.]|uniref:ATP-binding protein n=1 Tax=Rhodoblastus sp. TaxID=1962975 RepID=UPI003F94880D
MVASAFVTRKVTTTIAEKIDYVRAIRRTGAEPSCILVSGLQGTGKSTFLSQYEGANPPHREKGTIIRPVLYASFPSNTAPIGAAKIILRRLFFEQLGHLDEPQLTEPQYKALKAFTSGDLFDLTVRVKQQLLAQRVEVVLNDEFQHVAERGREKSVAKAADWVKELVKDTNVPFVMAGMPSISILVEGNHQLSDITKYRFELSFFRYEKESEKLAFKDFVARLELAFPFNREAGFARPHILLALFNASGGSLRQLGRMLIDAAFHAIDRNAEFMTVDDLAFGFAENAVNSPLAKNPFSDLLALLGGMQQL